MEMTIEKAEIAKQLQTMVGERLFGAKPWPIDNNHENHEVRQKLIDWGLIEMQGGSFRTTALGKELNIDLMSAFMGHHEPSEIPDMLCEHGLMSNEEADSIILDRWERDGEKLEDILPPILRRLYRTPRVDKN
jgi:hypothetical protein